MEPELIKARYEAIKPHLDERLRRLFAAAEAMALGHSGISFVSQATGLSRNAIARGMQEITAQPSPPNKRVREKGGGRKRTLDKDPTLQSDLEGLIEPLTRGDPESPLRWTCKSLRKLADELKAQGHATSHRMVGELLKDLGYSLQANKKTLEGTSHPDRNAQFEYIYQSVSSFQENNQPVISVDTKKKELVGPFKNNGREYQPKGQPEEVNVHDFKDPLLGRASPYGIYDLNHDYGWVNVGIDNDTSAFAVESIRRWWWSMGCKVYPEAKELLITADSGGSNGYRVRLWKVELQKLANETGLAITVRHFPPGTSKWNKIEHRLFSFISQNWRGRPLVNHEVIVNLIAGTKTKSGLEVSCQLDTNTYPKGTKISDNEMKALNLKREEFHGEWNYTISPIQHEMR
jgi:transposase